VQEFEASAISTERFELGECCRWDDVRAELSWVDVPAGRFYRARTSRSLSIIRTYQVDGFLSAVAPFAQRSEGWIVGTNQSIAHLHESGDMVELARPEAPNAPDVRMNDGACDPWGRFLVGSMALDVAPGRGSLYRFESGREVEALFSSVTVSNGLGWSPDRHTMYYVDSGPGTIHTFDVDDAGNLGRRSCSFTSIRLECSPPMVCASTRRAVCGWRFGTGERCDDSHPVANNWLGSRCPSLGRRVARWEATRALCCTSRRRGKD
jgi:sugar lactone lactonase YvrE